jgi:hypothetical protein
LSLERVPSLLATSVEPGILYGFTNLWSGEIHLHVNDVSSRFSLEAIGFEQRFFLYDGSAQEHATPFNAGALMEFEKGIGGNPDRLDVRGMISGEFQPFEAALNLGYSRSLSTGETPSLEYAVGAKYAFLPSLSLGVELTGDLRHPSNSSLTPGLYVGLGGGVQARLGASFAQTARTTQTTVRLSFVSEF